MTFKTYYSNVENIRENPAGRYQFAKGKRVSRLPFVDLETGAFASLDQAHAEAYGRYIGARLATHAEIEQIAKQAYFVSPVIVRETAEERTERLKRGGSNPLEKMATVEWAMRERAGVESQLRQWDGDRPVLNAGKLWEERTAQDKARGVAVNVGWDTDPRVDVTAWIQTPGRAHGAGRVDDPSTPQNEDAKGHTDYSQTLVYVWDEDEPSDAPMPLRGLVVPPAPMPPKVVQIETVNAFGGPGYMPDAITLVTKNEAFEAIKANTSELSRSSVIVLLAHWDLETGGGKSMHRFNMGNIKHTRNDGKAWTMFRCSEIIGGREVFFDPPHEQTWFRAYTSLEAGAAEYVGLLRKRFAKAWPSVVAGNPEAFSHALKLQGYYTANEAAYTRVMRQRFDALDPVIGFDVAGALEVLGYPDVASFQRATKGLSVDGIAGKFTIQAMKLALDRKAAGKC